MTRRRKLTWATAVTAVALAIGCGSAPDDDQAVPTNVDATAPAAGAKKAAKPSGVADGTHAVPGEIKPGTYTTTAATDGFGCYWARLKGFSGELSDIAANGNIDAGAKGRFTVSAKDKGVTLTGGCRWVKAA